VGLRVTISTSPARQACLSRRIRIKRDFTITRNVTSPGGSQHESYQVDRMKSPFTIGIDIGGTNVGVSLYEIETSTIAEKREFPTDPQCAPADIVRQISEAASTWIEQRVEQPKSIGISVGGMFDVRSGCMRHAPHLPRWDGFPIVETIGKAFGVPVFAENDANACALAEWRHGAGKGCQDLIFLTFGTGLGGGLILGGHLYRGVIGLAGEVGAIRVSSEGPPIRGKPGCLEGFASGAGIAMQAKALLKDRENTFLSKEPTTKEIAQAALAGDPFSTSLFRQSGQQLGRGLAILIDLLNPEVIILGSIFARCESLLRPAMEGAIAEEAMSATRDACRVVPAQLGESIGDFAAATVAELASHDH